MEIKILVGRSEDGSSFALILRLEDPDGNSHDQILTSGFASAVDALAALIDCLTFSPPDMGIYDLAATKVGELTDQLAVDMPAITQRLDDLEEAVKVIGPAPVPPPRVNPLLAGRQAAQAGHVPVATPAPRPSIRKPTVMTIDIERAQGSPPAGRVHSSYGGPSRRGAAVPENQE